MTTCGKLKWSFRGKRPVIIYRQGGGGGGGFGAKKGEI